MVNPHLDIRLQGRLLLPDDKMRRKTQGQQSHNGKPSLHPWQDHKFSVRGQSASVELSGSPLTVIRRNKNRRSYAETTGACEERRELIAARTKLLPNSHIGPGNLRQSVRTLSSAVTKSAISFSPIIPGRRILSTSMACPAT